MQTYNFSSPSDLSNYKKRMNSVFSNVTSSLYILAMVLYMICGKILSKSYNIDVWFVSYYSIVYTVIPFILPYIFILKNQIQKGSAARMSTLISTIRRRKELMQKSEEERANEWKDAQSKNVDKWYRVKQYPLYIATIIWCVLFLFSPIARMSNDIKVCITYDVDNSSAVIAMSVLSSIAIIVALAMFLVYLSLWKKILIWNYDEINLSDDEKRAILKAERYNYKEYKSQLAIEKRNKKEQHRHESNNSVQPKNTTQQYYKNNPETMTKLAKINELKELFDGGIITQEEYEKARADILGK